MIIQGDCIEVMAGMPENSVDAIVTDPPYGLEFMGKEWDRLWATRDKSQDLTGKSSSPFLAARVNEYRGGTTAQLWHTQWATQALRVLKPGGYLLAFGGTRTSHRLVCGLEDAGFEIRDTVLWLTGQGFPKNLDISKQIDKMAVAEREVIGRGNPMKSLGVMHDDDWKSNPEYSVTAPATEAAKEWQGWGTALKPAHEPICVARKPLSEKNVALNVLRWGTGGIDIDGSRISHDEPLKTTTRTQFIGNTYQGRIDGSLKDTGIASASSQGRWPANCILECTCEEVVEGEVKPSGSVSGNEPSRTGKNCYSEYGRVPFQAYDGKAIIHTDPNCPCYMLDEQSGELGKSQGGRAGHTAAYGGGYKREYYGDMKPGLGDSGGASRYFKQIMVDTRDLSMYNIDKQGGQSCGTIIELQRVAGMLNGVSQTIEQYMEGEGQRGFGNNTKASCQMDTKSTILTLIKQTIELRILLSCLEPYIENYMASLEKIINGLMELNIGGVKAAKYTNRLNVFILELQGHITAIAKIVSENIYGTGVAEIENIGTNITVSTEKLTRFFYCAKASRSERGNGNNHPTCKPIKLMEYLIKLVSREGATILDPFAGSGSTELACVALGRKCISIDQSAEYCEMARGRCTQMVLA